MHQHADLAQRAGLARVIEGNLAGDRDQRPGRDDGVGVTVGGRHALGAHDVAHRQVLLIRVPGQEQVEETSVAVELQGVHRNTAVQGQDQLTGRAPEGGIGRVRVLAGSCGGRRGRRGETSGPCTVGGEREAPGTALGGLVLDGSGLMRPGVRRCAAGGQKPVDTVECRLVRQRLWDAQGDLGVVSVNRDLLELVPGDGTAGLRRL